MTAIHLRGITKRFGSTTAVDGVDLVINSGELFFLLGPSGCGKTTLLRMIAGFIDPTGGSIHFGERDVTHLPPNKRNAGMVFQSYALWPHMSVFDNVAYGLAVRKVPLKEKRDRVMAALRSVRMAEYADRKPNQLSGGQQQRVALARALVIEPTVLLLDEPLSNLDAKLRLEMRTEITRICAETGITTVYVTHDQKEALSMASRVAVLKNGQIMQVGGPRELYDRPASRFVADFLGETNFLAAEVKSADEHLVQLETAAGPLLSAAATPTTPEGGNVTCSIRPEHLRVVESNSGGEPQPRTGETPVPPSHASEHASAIASPSRNRLQGKRLQTIYLGEHAQHLVELSDGTVLKVLEMPAGHFGEPGEIITLSVEPKDVILLAD